MSLSSDGRVLAVGGPLDNNGIGKDVGYGIKIKYVEDMMPARYR